MKLNSIILLFVLISMCTFAQERTVINVSGAVVNATSFTDKEVIVAGKTDLHVLAKYIPLTNTIIRLNSVDSWVFFDNIRPQSVIDSVLVNVFVDGSQAVHGENVRVSIYKHGAVVIPHGKDFKPLELFSQQNYGGDSQKFSLHTFHNSLGVFDNKARSFKLKRGYMATLANNADGTGYSRVFTAESADLEIPVMSSYLDNTVSFIRVFKWEWVSKKGWCQTGYMSKADPATNTNLMNCTWLYDWSAGNSSRPNFEYIPIKQNQYWPSWDQINGLKNVSHLMGYNEPDHTEQSNVSVATAVKEWPNYLKTGLRLGSPATTDFNWLYQFMDSCKKLNYRVDYIVVHAYWGGLTPQQWYNQLKAVHDKTGRGIWIKEWNNGANWTTEWWPDAYGDALTKQNTELRAILNVLDTAHFVERYSIYNWVGYKRMVITDDGWITPAGEYYRDNNSRMAYNKSNEIIPTYKFSSAKPVLNLESSSDKTKMNLSWTNADQEFAKEVVLEKKTENGTYTEIYRSNQTLLNTYSDTHDMSISGKISYRLRVLLNNATEQVSNEQNFEVLDGNDIQYGQLTYQGVNENIIAFKNNFSTIPLVITGAPTNNNSSTLLNGKVSISSNRMFTYQIQPWNYQKISTLEKAESVPFFVLKPGNYNFGGLKVQASKSTSGATWKTVSFAQAFDKLPVVLVSLATANNKIPVIVRVRNVTKTGFEVILQKESAVEQQLVTEIFSYVAIEEGAGMVNNNKIYVGRTTENAVGNAITQFARITYPETITDPVFLAQLQTCNDDTVTAVLRCRSVLTTEARVFKQRELSAGITVSANETAGYILINKDFVNDIQVPELSTLMVYPNPVKEKLFFVGNNESDFEIEIYSLYGALVKKGRVEGASFDVDNLISGIYIVKCKGYQNLRFIKL